MGRRAWGYVDRRKREFQFSADLAEELYRWSRELARLERKLPEYEADGDLSRIERTRSDIAWHRKMLGLPGVAS
jgi:hypothetical protein